VREVRQPDGFDGNGVAYRHKGEKRQSFAAAEPVADIQSQPQSASLHKQCYLPGTDAGYMDHL
jgi:hypothetical protein